jgi:hypothetical protein
LGGSDADSPVRTCREYTARSFSTERKMIGRITLGTNDLPRAVEICGGCLRDPPEGEALNVFSAG